jgi:hypothetical protein
MILNRNHTIISELTKVRLLKGNRETNFILILTNNKFDILKNL